MEQRSPTITDQLSGGHVSRRNLVAGSAATAALTIAGSALPTMPAVAAENFALLRQRWCNAITGAADLDPADPRFDGGLDVVRQRSQDALALIDRTPGRTRVFADLTLEKPPTSASTAEKLAAIQAINQAYKRLRDMAIAWYTPGTLYHQDSALLHDIKDGLVTADAIAYNTTTTRWSNWWNFEIGIPNALTDLMVLLHDELSETERARYSAAITHYVPDPWLHDGVEWHAANRLSACSMTVVQALATDDTARLERGATGLPDTCALATGDTETQPGQGIWADGSYVLHSLPYTGVYGRTWLSDMSMMAALLPGTSWAITNAGAYRNLYNAVDTAFLPVFHDGRILSCFNGRMVAHAIYQEHALGVSVMTTILRLARSGAVTAETATRWRRRCLGAMARSGHDPYLNAGVARAGLFAELERSGLSPVEEPDGSVIFRNSARAVHRRNGRAFAIAMNSNRIDRYESINGENLKGWHQGEGATFLYDQDQTQYTDMFWPTVDAQRLAGTTVDGRVLPAGRSKDDGRIKSPYAWAGGATADGYSAVGMSLHSGATTSPIKGKKSWFCFDELIYCMGRGIVGGAGNPVETIVENRNLHENGGNALMINGAGWGGSDELVDNPLWAHLDGVGGYVFPAAANQTVRFRREQRTGNWGEIYTGADATSVTRHYLSMAIQHGSYPIDGRYRYLVIPGATAVRTQQLSDNPSVIVVAYNSGCHAVKQLSTGLWMYNFWEAGAATGASVDTRCSVIVQEIDDTLTISLADPMRSGSTIRITVTPQRTGYTLTGADTGVALVTNGPSVVLDVAAGTYGKTRSARFAR